MNLEYLTHADEITPYLDWMDKILCCTQKTWQIQLTFSASSCGYLAMKKATLHDDYW